MIDRDTIQNNQRLVIGKHRLFEFSGFRKKVFIKYIIKFFTIEL